MKAPGAQGLAAVRWYASCVRLTTQVFVVCQNDQHNAVIMFLLLRLHRRVAG
jgi:hypothetical protein